MPNSCISLLTNQVAALRREIEYLRQCLSEPDDASSDYDSKEEAEVTGTPTHINHGCFPGLEGQPCVNFPLALDQLVEVTNNVAVAKSSTTPSWGINTPSRLPNGATNGSPANH
ncbi:hypothetical protein DSO57_1036729 [Entomophthora muscae]|uniref:Uncharacterized protein n=1 Tax=Entomophthora muscae TaxID=34485 RepID=A0ACC2TXQ3_9FUNG|nr:hypothetical protein DSO57_1036729 [Entomophthora muscae]